MTQIELLHIGCTGQQLIDTVNALVAAHNDGMDVGTVSYNDLTDKPTLNGVEIAGAQTTEKLKIRISETEDYETWNETVATKAYADQAKADALAQAQTAVNAALANKLDKDLSNIEAVDAFSGEAYVPIVTASGTYKTTMGSIAAYAETQAQAAASAVNTAINRERRVLELTGEQNGKNTVFTVTGGYKPGTSSLYLNGQLLAEGRDYEETDSQTVTMLTYIPEADDVLVFRAIPSDTSRQ